ncbi:MAG TPA: hypothetical protein VE961_04650, partial [Pyrinomonadaceae bacterium]|nr:hypothetical protein [Pyrinomonadaceae bacterium]
MKKNYSLPFAILVGFVLIISSIACHRRSAADDETPDTSGYRPEATPATPYERDVKYVRDGHFVNIWVFRRKDDKPLTPEDSQVLRTNASRVVD